MTITNECMTVSLRISMWKGQRLDKAATEKITDQAGADRDAARVNKHLVPKKAIDPVQSAASALRTHLYDNTLPWKDSGERILTRRRYTKFIEEHEALVADFNAAVDKFLNEDYLAARDQAEFRMGDLFKADDYPSVMELRWKFRASLDIDAVTEGKDFRVDIADKGEMQARIERQKNERLGAAMHHLWDRLAKTLSHFAEKMSDKDARLYTSTITNLEELVELIPDMNIMDDPRLEDIRQKIAADLTGFDANDFRKNPEVRSAIGAKANQIMADMQGFMTAMEDAA